MFRNAYLIPCSYRWRYYAPRPNGSSSYVVLFANFLSYHGLLVMNHVSLRYLRAWRCRYFVLNVGGSPFCHYAVSFLRYRACRIRTVFGWPCLSFGRCRCVSLPTILRSRGYFLRNGCGYCLGRPNILSGGCAFACLCGWHVLWPYGLPAIAFSPLAYIGGYGNCRPRSDKNFGCLFRPDSPWRYCRVPRSHSMPCYSLKNGQCACYLRENIGHLPYLASKASRCGYYAIPKILPDLPHYFRRNGRRCYFVLRNIPSFSFRMDFFA